MATATKKKVSTKQPELAEGEWGDKVPKVVQDTVDEYVEAVREQAEALGNRNRLLDEVKTVMRKHGVLKVRISDEDGKLTKMISLESEDKLKVKKLKMPVAVGGDDSADDEE